LTRAIAAWKPERRAQGGYRFQESLAANRANAARSTGPRSPEGKAPATLYS
jgi:hypothetical protein